MLFYPYHVKDKKDEPAFTMPWDEIEDRKLKNRLIQLEVEDALDFDKQLDARELEIVRKSGINSESVKDLLRHRVGLGIVKYPKAAAFLVEQYERLHGRVFEKKKFTDMGKRWYEYHRPRNPQIMLGKPRILSPTLVRQVRFVVFDAPSGSGCFEQRLQRGRRAWGHHRVQPGQGHPGQGG